MNMKKLLLLIMKVTDEKRLDKSWFNHDEIDKLEVKYDQIIKMRDARKFA